jgi:hypothetical protein
LAHRLAHAIIQQQPGQDGHNIQVKRLTNELYSLVNTVKNTGDQRKLFKFRSAQNDAVIRPGEYVVELMTQYIVQGSISMNDPGEIPFPKFEEQDAEDYDQSSKLQQSMWAFLAKNTQRNMASMNDPNASGRSRVQLLGMYLNKMVGAKPKGEEPMEHWIHRRDEAMQAMKENKFLLMCVDFEHYESRLYQQSRLRAGVHMANDAMEHFLKTCVGGIYVLGTNQGE